MSQKPKHKKNSKWQLPQFQLGFELWEILTAFTLALTLASVLLWFSNLQPRHLNEEFIWQEQTKASLYNFSLEALALEKIDLQSVAELPPNTVCTATIDKDLKKENFNIAKAKLVEIREKVSEIHSHSKENIKHLKSEPSFQSLVSSYQNLINKISSNLERRLYLANLLLNLRQTRDLCCIHGFSEQFQTKIVTDFIDEIKNENNQTSKNTREYLSAISEYFQKEENREFTDENRAKLTKLYEPFWSLSSADSFLDLVELEKDVSLELLLKYEKWEKEYITDKKELAPKVTFILL